MQKHVLGGGGGGGGHQNFFAIYFDKLHGVECLKIIANDPSFINLFFL